MARSPRALRYAKPEDMPPGMVRLYQQREQGLNAEAKARVEAAASAPAYMGVPKYLQPDGGKAAKRANKYGAVATVVDGIRFDSKREARYYEALKLRQAAGEVRYFLRQVPLHLPGGTKLVVDFLIVEADGRIRYVDTKGRETDTFRVKKREVKHHYPVEIELA